LAWLGFDHKNDSLTLRKIISEIRIEYWFGLINKTDKKDLLVKEATSNTHIAITI